MRTMSVLTHNGYAIDYRGHIPLLSIIIRMAPTKHKHPHHLPSHNTLLLQQSFSPSNIPISKHPQTVGMLLPQHPCTVHAETTRVVLRICTRRRRRLYGGWWSCCLSRRCGSQIPNRIGWGMGFSKFEASGKHTMLLSDLSLYGSLSRCSGLSRSMLMNVSLELLMPLTKIYIQTMNITVIKVYKHWAVTHLCVLLPYLSMLDDSRPSSQNNQHYSSRVQLTSDVSGQTGKHSFAAVGRSSSLSRSWSDVAVQLKSSVEKGRKPYFLQEPYHSVAFSHSRFRCGWTITRYPTYFSCSSSCLSSESDCIKC